MRKIKKERFCRELEKEICYSPSDLNSKSNEFIEIELDEFEALRLCDHEEKSQIEAAETMKVSRATVQRLLISGRFKILEAMINNDCIKINKNFNINKGE